MARFLMLSTRSDDSMADNERAAMLKFTGLTHEELAWIRLERDPFPRIDFTRWDGIILCGSRFDVGAAPAAKSLKQREIETNLHKLLADIVQRDFPFFGVCYGLGLLTVQLGGAIDEQHGEEISAPVLTLTSQGLREPLLEGIPPRFRAYVGHHEAVSSLPSDMVVLVQGQECPVQMVRLGRNVFATQFHPELDLDGINFRIDFFEDAGYYPPEQRPQVEARVRGVDTSAAHSLLRNFVNRFGSGPAVA